MRTWRSPSATKPTVDALAARLRAEGVTPDGGPRRTGDGYYECVVRDPEGNRVEIAAAERHEAHEVTVMVGLVVLLVASVAAAQEPASAWPEVTQTARSHGPAGGGRAARSTKRTSRAQLEAIAAAGIGGVEITPIYGARGSEARYIDFLSPRWMEMLAHTTREAARLGLGVDMATGTGWPFGGPAVSAADGSSTLALLDGKLAGKPTDDEGEAGGAGRRGPGARSVFDRRARALPAPVLQGVRRTLPRGKALRAQFHDSFEYYNASWTPALPAVFQEMHGYDIQSYAAAARAASSRSTTDTLSRIKGDYRRTLAKLHLDYVNAWVTWAHAEGFKARNQAHGAPGNLLDLYARRRHSRDRILRPDGAADPGLRGDAVDVSVDPDPPR